MLQSLVTENLKGDSKEDGKSDFSKIDVSGIPLFEALPSWAIYPDLERAEWLNIIVSKLWPNISRSIENKIKVILHKKVKTGSFTGNRIIKACHDINVQVFISHFRYI